MPSLKEQVYAVLRENLVAVDPSYAGKLLKRASHWPLVTDQLVG